MFFKAMRTVSPALLMILAAGCASETETVVYGYNGPAPYAEQSDYVPPQAQGDFRKLGEKILLKAESLKFISSYNEIGRAPNVDHLMLVAPLKILHGWASSRFGIDKTPGKQVRFLIKDASIVEEVILVGGSMNKTFKNRYTGKMEVQLQFVDPEGHILSETSSSVMRSVVLPRDASKEEHENAWTILTFDMIKALSKRLDQYLASPAYDDFIVR